MLAGLLGKALLRVVLVILVVGSGAAAVGYLHQLEDAEEGSIRMLALEAGRVIPPPVLELPEAERRRAFQAATEIMVGGVFAVGEVYSAEGVKIAESIQPGFESIERTLSSLPHAAPPRQGGYDSNLVDGRQILRVFTPLVGRDGKLIGHLEGVRVLGENELSRIRHSGLVAALIAGASVLLCALVLAPLLTGLAVKNFKRARLLLEAHVSMLEALGRAIAKRDSDTGVHNYRVAWMAARLGEEIGLDGHHMRSLIAGSFLHDVGKIGIPDDILLKPGKLDPQEFAAMQEHVNLGGQIAGEVGFLADAREVIECHHEKWDGSGYPKRLTGAAIPLAARIFCIADVFDALRAKRPYKEPFGLEQAMQIMREGRGRHFDPALLDAFERIVPEVESKAIGAGEPEAMELMRQMAHKHFFGDVAGAAA